MNQLLRELVSNRRFETSIIVSTVIPPNSRFLGLRKGPRVWKPRIWVHIYVVKVKKGAEPFSKVHFLGDFEVRCSQMDVLPNKNATYRKTCNKSRLLIFSFWIFPRLSLKVDSH